MIYELEKIDFYKVDHIFEEQDNHPIIQGVIRGNNRGRIYVDDLYHPKTALIWAINEMYYLGGQADNENFNNFLEELLFNKIAPEAIKIGDSCFQLEVFQKGEWEEFLESLLSSRLLKIYYRRAFAFNKDKYLKGICQSTLSVPEGYTLRRIDRELLETEGRKVLQEKILQHWYSIEDFLNLGIGYCIVHNNEVVNYSISAYSYEKNLEIGICTFGVRHRNKGLATITSRALIEACVSKGITPHWTTESFRHASSAVAEKLGFEDMVEFPCYLIFYKEQDNLIFSGYYELKRNKNITAGEKYFEKAISLGDLEPWHYFYMACGYAEAGLSYSAVNYLNAAVSRGWQDVGDVVFDNDLKSLHCLLEWNQIINKLEKNLGYSIQVLKN
jgi:hypothetical protein